ncbi:invasin domain 3-containing protein [Providencia sp. CRE-3FA-0001]|uniref:Invasin domain 3-containing protein n=1 Tax=Providencia huashanensis TaxID=3037798 RepID=A0AA42K303_9GAMM|nr:MULTISPECIES: invasin domain 3-containing protein [Providencia]EJD6662636.1 inverse autotransporter beta domain-containing protein [Providencia rettgeri]ELR5076476.1 inverse autotransporter beta domain-containing protein [Providencia rettgeri]ELR5174390.1 inverse autotransporter beta domain-containing protein [Providencia rettgeri]ELR5196875.1 inverse autotransporter beta domain-containing protein [Providencia rettgeri]EMB8479704.1 inverse autotransporter beta domain-containing protein [Pro
MSPTTSTAKPTLRHRLSNGFVIFTAIWSSAVMPVMPSYAKMLSPDELPTLGGDSLPLDDNKTEQLIAEYSQSAARFISDKKKAADLAELAQDYTRNKVTNAATNEINHWLSQTGNAKFSVDVDKKLKIKNTQLDWLIPWYDQPDLLLFTQHNVHRTDGRLQTNNGVGVRHFTPDSMVGTNAFFDHDLSRYHSRVGFGVEYAQDFLKLSANTYLRTSSWRGASELKNDYNARPANGWDLQAEGFLPSYPHLGGNLKFEQYFGDDVALFGKDKRQKNPLATTIGMSWTPFSLVTLSAEQKISGGLSETNAKMEFTWTLGKSLAEHLDPTKVVESRRLLGSRYDFVNRNNNIVLEYQKKTLISLSLPDMVQGKTGDILPIINSLSTKYPLKDITVQAPEFLAAGGEILLDGAKTKVKLPTYKVAMTKEESKKNNRYRFTITASDHNGNHSPQGTTWVEVTDYGVLSINPNEVIKQGNAIANGQDINTLTIIARDALGNIAPDSVVTFTLPAELKLATPKATSSQMAFSNLFKKMQAAKSTTQSKYRVITNMKGEASIQFTSLVTGKHRIQATANGGVPVEAAFSFIADTRQAHINHFNILSDNAVADGKSTNKIQFHITDNHAHPIQGAMLQLDAENANATQLSPTDEQGNTDVEVDSKIAGTTKLSATLNEQRVEVKVNFVFGQLANVSILDLEKTAAGTDSIIMISLTDQYNNPISGADGSVIANIDGQPTPITISETFAGSGVYIGTLPGQQSGTPNVTVTIGTHTSSPEVLIVESPKPITPLTPDGTGKKGEKGVVDNITITPSSPYSLQSGDTLDVTVTIKDAFGNGLTDLNSNNINIGKYQGDTLKWIDNGDGSYTTSLPLTEVGTNDLTVSVNGTMSPATKVEVGNATGTKNVDNVKVTNISKPAAGENGTVTFQLSDKHNNPIVGEKEITVNIDGQPHTLPVTETSPGTYEAIIQGQIAGNHYISVVVNGKESPKELLIVDKPQPIKPKDPSGIGQKGEQGVVDNIAITTGDTSHLQSGDKLEITVTITDAFNNGLSGLDTNNINIGKHKGDTLKWVDNQDGSYSTNIELTEIGNNDLTVSINGSTSPQKQTQVSHAKGKDKVSKIVITNPPTPAAGAQSTLTVKLTDKNGNPVVGEQEMVIKIDGKPYTLPAKEGKPGIYEVTLPALQAGKHDIHVSLNGTTSIKEKLLVEQPKSISPNNPNGTGQLGEKGVIDKVAITVDHTHRFESGNPLDVTVTVSDAFGNGLAGLNTDNIDVGKHKGNTLKWGDNGDGSYTTTLTLTEVGSNDLTASVNGTRSPLTEVQVNNATGASHVDQVKITKTEKPAAGSNSIVTIELTDKHGNLVAGEKEITINIDGQAHKLPAREMKPGIYEVTLPALQAGNHSISANVNSKVSTENTIVVAKPTPIKSNNTGKLGEKGVVNNIAMTMGDTSNLQSGDQLGITVTITDAFHNGLTEINTHTINLDGFNGKPVWKDEGDGSYTTTITLTEIGSKDLTASINGQKTPATAIQVSNASGKNNVSKVEITKIEKADAGSNSTLTVKLTDKNGNPVVGEQEIIIEIDGKKHTLPIKEIAPQTYEVILPGQHEGKHSIIAEVNNKLSGVKTLVVEKSKPIKSINPTGSGLQGAKGVIDKITMTTGSVANLQSGDALRVMVTLTDIFGNTLTGIDTSNIILDGYNAGTLQWIDNANGTYSTTLPLTQIGDYKLTASISGHKTPHTPINVANTTNSAKVSNIIFDAIPSSATGDNRVITLKVTDANQHPVTQIANEIQVTIEGKTNTLQLAESTTNKGTYMAVLPAQMPGTYIINAKVNTKTETRIWVVGAANTITASPQGQLNERGTLNTIEFQISPHNGLKVGDTLTLTATMKDAFDNTLVGVDTSAIKLTHNQRLAPVWTDSKNGTYTADLMLTALGEDLLVAKVNSTQSDPVKIDVKKTQGDKHINKVVITHITPSVGAGAESTLTFTLADVQGNPVDGIQQVEVEIDQLKPKKINVNQQADGSYTGTLAGQLSGAHEVVISTNGLKSKPKTLNVAQADTVTATTDGSGIKDKQGVVSSVVLSAPNTTLTSGANVQLTVSLKDAFHNPLKGVSSKHIALQHSQMGSVAWVDHNNGNYTATLPLNKLGPDTLKATVNSIASQAVTVDVQNTNQVTQISTLELSPIAPTAAGHSPTLTVKALDINQHGVTQIADDFKVTLNGALIDAIFTESLTSKGAYTVTLPPQKVGKYTVKVTAYKQTAQQTWEVNVASVITATNTSGTGTQGARGVVKTAELTAVSTQNLKSGDSVRLTLTLKDAFDNPLSGIDVKNIKLTHNQTGNGLWVDNKDGTYIADLMLTALGEDLLVAKVNSSQSDPVKIDVKKTQGDKHINNVVITHITPSVGAGAESTLTFTLADVQGNPVDGIQQVEVAIDQLKPKKINVNQQADGSYTGTLAGQLSGAHEVVISTNGLKSKPKTLNVAQADTVTATADGSGIKDKQGVVSSVVLSASKTALTSGTNVQLTVSLKDTFHNPLKGVSSKHIALQHNQTGSVAWVDHNNGNYTATLPLNKLGADTLKATVNSIASQAVTVDVQNANQVAQISTLELSPIAPTAAGHSPTLMVKALDINQHGVTQIADDFKVTLNGALIDAIFTESLTSKGAYTATLPPKKAGSYTVEVRANTHTVTQIWVVNAATVTKATHHDGSGVQGQIGVVNTAELAIKTAANLKSMDTIKLTLTLKDAFDNPLSGIDVKNIELTHNQTSNVLWVDNKDGTYTADLMLTALGEDHLVAKVNSSQSDPVKIAVGHAEGDSKVSQIKILSSMPVPMLAGVGGTLALSITDKNGHPVANINQVSFGIINGSSYAHNVSQLANGNYIFTLPTLQAGGYTFRISIYKVSDTISLTVEKPKVILADKPDGSGATDSRGVVKNVQFDPIQITHQQAGNKLKLTVTLTDHFDHKLIGVSRGIMTKTKQASSVKWQDNADGSYSTELLLSKVGTDTLQVTVNNISQSQTIQVNAPEGKSAVHSVELKETGKTFMVGDSVELQLTLTDSHGNGVEKVQASDIRLEHNNTLISALSWQELGTGVYTTTLPLHKQGRNTFVSRVNNQASTPLAVSVNALTGPTQVKTVQLNASTNQLTVGSKTELTLTLLDQWNNGVGGITAKDITINDTHIKKNLTGLIWTPQGNGIYTAPTTVSTVGVHSLKATVNLIESHNVLVDAQPSTNQSHINKVKLTTNLSTITAGSKVTLSLKITDINDNPVIKLDNHKITLTESNNTIPTVWDEDLHGLGIYSTSIKLTKVKTHKLKAEIGQFTDITNVMVNSPSGKDAVTAIAISPIARSEAGEASSFLIHLTDQYRNPVNNVLSSDITVKINGQKQNIIFTEKNILNGYTAHLPAAKANSYQIMVEVNGLSKTAEWVVNPPIAVPITSYDKNGLRRSLETIFITHNAQSTTINSGDKVTLTVALRDKFDNKLTGAKNALNLLTNLQPTTAWIEVSDGLYTQEVIMNKLHKQSIQVVANKMLSDKLELTISPAEGVSHVHKTRLETKEGTIEAGKEVTLTLTLTDSVDNGVIKVDTNDIQFTSNQKAVKTTWANIQDGVYTTKQRLETVGNYQFKAVVNNQPSRIQTVEATYPSGKDAVKAAYISANTNMVSAGENVELTLTLKDQYQNLVTGVNGADIALKDSQTAETIDNRNIVWNMASAGVYKATLPLTKVGKHTLTATVNKQNTNTNEITVAALKGASNVKEIKLTANNGSINVGGSTTLTLTLLDNYGNEVADVTSTAIKFRNTDSTITTTAKWVKSTSQDGVYTALVTLDKVKRHILSVDVNSQTKNIEIDVKLLEGANNVASVELKAPTTAKLGSNVPLTLKLKDKLGYAVVAANSSDITLKRAGASIPASWVEGNDGNYTSSIVLTKAGLHALEVEVNRHSSTTSITVEHSKNVKSVENISITPSIATNSSGKYTTQPGQQFELIFTLTGQYDQGITELKETDISLIETQTSKSVPIKAWQEDPMQKGTYTASISLETAALHSLTAKINGLSEKIEVTVIPFNRPDNVASIELQLDRPKAIVGENVNLKLAIKDKYGNDVDIDVNEIKLSDTHNGSLTSQVKWDSKKGTFTHQYTGILKLAKKGEYTIFASVATTESRPKIISIAPIEPVFTKGKSSLVAATYETSTDKIENTKITLTLKSKDGNMMTGKQPKLAFTSAKNSGQSVRVMSEETPGIYVTEYRNTSDSEIVNIKLENSSIDYTGREQSIQIVNYGKISIKPIDGNSNILTTDKDEKFPSTGFVDVSFYINPSVGTSYDYNWTVDQNWLSVNNLGEVKMKKQPENSSQAKVTIIGKAKANNINDMVYTFTLKSWYIKKEEGTPQDAINNCQPPYGPLTKENLQSLTKEWNMFAIYLRLMKVSQNWVHDSNSHFLRAVMDTKSISLVGSHQIDSEIQIGITCVRQY